MKRLKKIAFLYLLIVIYCCSLSAEQLAVKNFSIDEGLARNQVSTIYNDSRGFIWFATADGLSRFDGYEFTNYKTQHGLPNPVISGIAEAESGIYWIATHSGLCLIDFNAPLSEDKKLKIQKIKLGNFDNSIVYSIFLTRNKQLWAGTRDGLYKIRRENNEIFSEKIQLGENNLPRRDGVGNFVEDENQNLWIVTPDGLFRIDSENKIKGFQLAKNDYFDRLGNIAIDNSGRLWIGGLDGLYIVKPPVNSEVLKQIKNFDNQPRLPENAGEFVVLTEKQGLADKKVLEIFRSPDNRIWLATRRGISLFDGQVFRNFTTANGLISNEILCFGRDETGNIWIGTESTGVMRVAGNGFTTFTTADGLSDNRISSVFEGSDGEIYAVDGSRNINRFQNGKFVSVRPDFPRNITEFGWSWQNPVVRDKRGEWWFATAQGIVRFPKVKEIEKLANTAPLGFYDSTNGLPGNQIYRIFEAKNGDIWFSNFAPPNAGITRWENSTQTFHKIENKEIENLSAYSFAEDNFGNLWLGLSSGKIVRLRGGQVQILENVENLPKTIVYDMLPDKKGNLWLATGSGAYFVENLSADQPTFKSLTINDGLTTNDIISITEDLNGRIYLATSQGVHRYTHETKRIELFTTADGLANSELRTAVRSKNGNLWFGTVRGLTLFEPEKLKEINQPAAIFVRSIQLSGKAVPLSELGEEKISGIEILPNQNHIDIEVLGLSLNSGDILKYQYKFRETDDWSEPTTQRKFTLVNLQPGNYQFQARVINSGNLISQNLAAVSFTVLAPFYLRWWFLLIFVSIICLLAYFFYRSRLKRLIELEKVRHSIATDLHDDIGSSLSQISLISEVLALKEKDDIEDKESLETIAKTSREAVGSMSEMVWAINPKSDNLADTIQRMRRFTSETLSAADIRFVFHTTDFDKRSKIDVNIRRHIYLIYKEIINNIVKHSEALEVSINISQSGNDLLITAADNGKGFLENEIQTGNGLANMRSRAEKIGGTLKIKSESGKGTFIYLQVSKKNKIFSKFTT